MTLRITMLYGITYKQKGRDFCPLDINSQCFSFILALPSCYRFPRRPHAQPLLCSSVGTMLSLKPWGLGTALLCLIADSLLSCPGISSSHALHIQHTAARLIINLTVIPGYGALILCCFSINICSACLPFVLAHNSVNVKQLEWLQHCNCLSPFALQCTPTKYCHIFNPQS